MKIIINCLKSALKAWVDLQEKDFTSLDKLQAYASKKNCERGICYFVYVKYHFDNYMKFSTYYKNNFFGYFMVDPIYSCENLRTALESIEYRIQWLKKK